MSTTISLGSTTITVPSYVVCLDQENINTIRKDSDLSERIVGAGTHFDGTVTFILATGQILIFDPAQYYIPDGPYLPQEDGFTVFLPNNNGRWPGPSRGFSVQSTWLIKRSKHGIVGAELFLKDKSVGKFDFEIKQLRSKELE